MGRRIQAVDEAAAGLPAEQAQVLERLREIVLGADPVMEEQWKWSRPCYYHGGKLICYIAFQKKYVSFGFQRGSSLADPDGLLEGTGKDMRHVKIRTRDDVRDDVFAGWVKAAVQLDANPS